MKPIPNRPTGPTPAPVNPVNPTVRPPPPNPDESEDSTYIDTNDLGRTSSINLKKLGLSDPTVCMFDFEAYIFAA